MATKRELRHRWQVEPGLTIRQRIIDFSMPLQFGHGRSSEELFRLLDGLPFRCEVPSGRDLRGSDCAGGVEMDFSNTDFSYSVEIGHLLQCDLTNARFDELSCRSGNFGDALCGASFRKAKLRSCFLMKSDARNCCFDGANLYHTRFDDTDLSGSSFRGANCKGVCFFGCNLLGCDFRGANLGETVLQSTKIDKSTDIRGANLINAYYESQFNNQGHLVGRGVDPQLATFDPTTKFLQDPNLHTIEYLEQATEIARKEHSVDGDRIAALMGRLKEQLRTRHSEEWEDDLVSQLDDRQRDLYQEIKERTFENML